MEAGRRRRPGEVLGLRPEGLAVACADGAIAFAELQLPGRRRMPAAARARRSPHPDGHGPRVTGPGAGAAPAQAGVGAAAAAPPPRAGAALTARSLARAVLERVEVGGAYANRALSAALDRATALGPEDRGLATELVYGVLRRRARIDRALSPLATSGLDRLDPRVLIALRVGAYQILFLDRVPAYAAVDDAVDACKQIAGRGVAGFANALLRRLGRQGEPPLPDATVDPAGYLVAAAGLPAWLAELLLAELPAAEALAFAASIAEPAPVTLRANTGRVTRDQLATALASERAGALLAPSEVAPDALDARRLDAPASTQAWRQGLFAIADAGAQIAVELCGAAAGERILDACAGSGGKTAHLLALAGDRARVDAIDIATDKLGAARADAPAPGDDGRDVHRARPDQAARRSDAALSPDPARRAVQRAGRVAPPPGGAGAARARRSGDAGRAAAAHAVGRRAGVAAGRPAGLRRLHVRAP